MPSATFTHQATASTPAAAVWESLQNAETWANIGPVEGVHDAVHGEDGDLTSFRWHTSVAARRYPGVAAVSEAQPQERMLLELDAREVVGSLEALLEPNGDGTTVITINLRVTSKGTLSTLFFPVVSEAIAKGLPRQVDEFARSLS
ncbi:MAG: SRPBCC family protein [bacterium]|nr:SRPBCC family protein [bacterium]